MGSRQSTKEEENVNKDFIFIQRNFAILIFTLFQKQIDADIIAIIFAIVLQDIPFICLRLTLILK